jgi:hypothetical protein
MNIRIPFFWNPILFAICTSTFGARGNVVVKALCYRSEGLGLNTHTMLSIGNVLPPLFVNLCSACYTRIKGKLKIHYDRQSVGQSVLVSGAHLGPATNFSFSLRFSFRQLRVCYFVAPSLTRGRVCNVLLLLVLASAVPLIFLKESMRWVTGSTQPREYN